MSKAGVLVVRVANLADPEERGRIEAWLAARPTALPFHRPQWSLGVERGCRQRSHYLVAERGSLVGVLPLTEIRSRLFGSALVSTGFGTGGGIVADDEAVREALAAAAWERAQALGCATLEIRGGWLPDDWPRSEGTYSSFARDLGGDKEAILASIPRRQRAEVRRGLGFGLETTVGSGRIERDAHYRVYSENVRNHGTPIFPRGLFEAMLDTFGDDADILIVWKDGKPLSSTLNFYFNGIAYPYWGGGTGEARRWRANEVLYYALMCHALERGCRRIDFGRSKLGTGAHDRKRIWHMETTPLVYAVRTAEGAAPRVINPLSPKYRLQVALWSKLPLWLANRLGPPIARGLG